MTTILDATPIDVVEITRLRRQLQRQDLVLEITRLLTGEINRGIDHLLGLIAEKTCLALNADRTTVFLVDTTAGQLVMKVASELEIKEIRLPIGVGLAGYVGKTGEILSIPDAYLDSRFDKSWDKRTGYRTRSMLVMPMYGHDGDVIGVFQVINKLLEDGSMPDFEAEHCPHFSDEDVEFLGSIAASAAIAIQNALLVEETKGMFSSTVQVLAATMDRRNKETSGHSDRVSLSAVILARRLRLTPLEVEKIRYAGLLHDVGKVGVRDAVLTKPGRLEPDELQEMQDHARYTREILSEIRFLRGYEDIPNVAGQHHERLDGTGYPLRQKEDEITLGGRLLAVADMYDALRQRRVYKPAFTIQESLKIIHEEVERHHLDPKAVTLLEECLDEIEKTCGPLRPGWEEEQAGAIASAAPAAPSSSSPPTPAPAIAASPTR